jgi:DNA polymerase-3 subunit epsilon
MGQLHKETFVCLDCESTGLDPESDRLIEVAAIRFTFTKELDAFESLVDPQCEIPQASIDIHHITQDMVEGKPLARSILPEVMDFVGDSIIVGHAIAFDINLINAEARRCGLARELKLTQSIDTLRLARLYGESPTNSLERLRQHFNIEAEGAHRAMGDVIVNVEVFKRLTTRFKSTQEIAKALSKPILLRTMPLGKHKGRLLRDIPHEYLRWAANKDFDQDLLYTIRSELKRRKKGNSFSQATNPFSDLQI